MRLAKPIISWYGRYERPISSFSLVLGFVFDAVTLRRVDTLFENIWIVSHLFIVGLFIILIHLKEKKEGGESNPDEAHFWYVNILQFFFGGILSTYLVFYFRSADIFTAWPFILLLIIAFIANESFKRHYIRLSFQISLLFLSIYLFMIFLIPILTHRIGSLVFILAGVVSLILISIFIAILFYFIKEKFLKNRKTIHYSVLSIFVLVNILYFTNLIPPIPLSLKDAGIYHKIEKDATGNYLITQEDHGWRRYFELYPEFTHADNAPVYAFSAIFSPKNLNLSIIHEWQYYNEIKGSWQTESTTSLKILGGRDDGFRTYSARTNLRDGKWRVRIKTSQNQTIGHIKFKIVAPTENIPILKTILK